MDLIDLPENPCPHGAVIEAVRTSDGVTLRCVRWPSLSRRPRGTICLFQGRSEFVEKYFEVVRDLRARGFAVATFDWRGQGGSDRQIPDGRLGHVRDFSEYGRDLEAFMRQVALPECPAPFYALAHSMGAAILLSQLPSRGTWFERLVATAPMIDLHGRPPSARALTVLFSLLGRARKVVPGFPPTPMVLIPFERNRVTSDRARYDRCAAVARVRPEIAIGGPTVSWVRSALAVCHRLADPAFAQTWHTPTLMLLAGEDKVVSTVAAEQLCRRLRGSGSLIISGARHELMQEQDMLRNRFWAAFDAFIPGTGAETPDYTAL